MFTVEGRGVHDDVGRGGPRLLLFDSLEPVVLAHDELLVDGHRARGKDQGGRGARGLQLLAGVEELGGVRLSELPP